MWQVFPGLTSLGNGGAFALTVPSPEIRIMSQADLSQWVDRELGPDAFVDVVNLATFAGHYGEPELAARLLRITIEKRPVGGYPFIVMWWPSMAEMRRTDEFKQIARYGTACCVARQQRLARCMPPFAK
jgi:hypothetical protein